MTKDQLIYSCMSFFFFWIQSITIQSQKHTWYKSYIDFIKLIKKKYTCYFDMQAQTASKSNSSLFSCHSIQFQTTEHGWKFSYKRVESRSSSFASNHQQFVNERHPQISQEYRLTMDGLIQSHISYRPKISLSFSSLFLILPFEQFFLIAYKTQI